MHVRRSMPKEKSGLDFDISVSSRKVEVYCISNWFQMFSTAFRILKTWPIQHIS